MTRAREACLSDEQLEALVTGASLDAAERSHADACERCRHRLEEIRANNAFLVEVRESRAGEAAERGAAGALRADEAIPGYTVLGEIHRGGQGVVYRAVQEGANRTVAIKMLARGAFASSRQRQRFQQEIETVANLSHPNIVTVYETGALPAGRMGYVMEYIEGQRLDAWASALPGPAGARDFGRLLSRKLAVFLRICDAVQHAHGHGVIHRDLKPDNILVDAEDQPHVLDFGIAKALHEDAPVAATHTGEFVGTIRYASPEQLAGRPDDTDVRTDVYTLGVLLYEFITGEHPQPQGGSVQDSIRAIREVEPRRPEFIDHRLDVDLGTIALKALAKDPDRRYQTAQALADDIRRYQEDKPIEARRDSTWYVLRKAARRHRTPVVLGFALVGSLVALVVGLSVLYNEAESRRRQTRQALTDSNLARGRGAMLRGATVLAEDLLWQEFLTTPTPPGTDGADAPGPLAAYWALLELYAEQPCLLTIDTGVAGWSNICFVDEGRTLVSAGTDGAIRLWDATDGSRLGVLSEGDERITGLAHCPTTDRLAWCTVGGRIAVLDMQSRTLIGEHRTGRAIEDLALSPDGRTIAWIDGASLGLIESPRTGSSSAHPVPRGPCESRSAPTAAASRRSARSGSPSWIPEHSGPGRPCSTTSGETTRSSGAMDGETVYFGGLHAVRAWHPGQRSRPEPDRQTRWSGDGHGRLIRPPRHGRRRSCAPGLDG